MKIAQVVASYPPHTGGVETHVSRLARELAETGDEVTVLTCQRAGEPRTEFADGVRVLRFPLTTRSAAYPFSRGLHRWVASRAGGFDVVHAHSYHTVAGQSARRAGRPFVFTPHYHGTGGHTAFSWLLHRAYRPLGGSLLTAADAIICVSEAELKSLTRDFPRTTGKITTIPNGTDPRGGAGGGTAGHGAANGTGTGAAPVVLTVGRLERYKNVDLVIRAFARLRPPASLVIVGDGPDRARLERLARSARDAPPIRFTGRISEPELDRLLASAAVVTSASSHEAFGLIVADGLTAGARVVASAIPAHREVAALAGAGAPAAFVDPRNTPEFAAALSRALAAGRVPPGSTRLPTWGDVATRTREIYAGLATAAGGRRREFA